MTLPVPITFDEANRVIVIGNESAATTTISALELYSEWKRQMAVSGSLAAVPPAFAESVGGNDLGGGARVGQYVFVHNDLGWRIRPDERDHTLVFDGNLFPVDPLSPIFVPTLGGWTVAIEIRTSAQATLVETGVSGLTAQESADLALIRKILQNRRVTDPASGQDTLYDDDDVTVLLSRLIYEDAARSQPYRGDGLEAVDRWT